MNLSKRVIILDRLNSPSIAQAIFILKDNDESEFYALDEAERIVSDYISGNVRFEKKKHSLVMLASALLAAAIILAVVFFL